MCDGQGYPDGLMGEDIPLEARIIAVPDAFDAMASLRPHRSAIPLKDILLEMEEYKGKQFDLKDEGRKTKDDRRGTKSRYFL